MKVSMRSLVSDCQRVSLLAGAHDVLSAKLVEQAGFDAVWASSLEISAAWGKVDNDNVTMDDVLRVTRAMAGAVNIPVLVDAGTGWGDVGDVELVVRAFQAAGAAGMCIEDAAYPRRNSLLPGARKLAVASEFCDRILAACGARSSSDFSIVARTEALVADLGVDEALNRAALYADAGAEAVVIHSRSSLSDSIALTAKKWKGSAPLVLIPTMYPQLSVKEMQQFGSVSMVIYANQGLRAAMQATRFAFRQILEQGQASVVDDWIAPVQDLLELQSPTEVDLQIAAVDESSGS